MEVTSLQFAGFWSRLGSMLLDIVIMSPWVVAAMLGRQHYRLYDVYAILPQMAFGLIFFVYLVGRYGGTPGKLLIGLRVIKVNQEPLNMGSAFKRILPLFLLDTLWRIGFAIPLVRMTDAEYFAIERGKRFVEITGEAPPWFHWVEIALMVWLLSEIAVLLTNGKRRAIHDYFAGTVVIRKAPNKSLNTETPKDGAPVS